MVNRKLCLNCGKIITFKKQGNHKKYCSNNCGYHYRKKSGLSVRGNLMTQECKICGKKFYINKSQKKVGYKFCSVKCSSKYLGVMRSKERVKKKKFLCKNCGKEFYDYGYKIRKYCKIECFRKKGRLF